MKSLRCVISENSPFTAIILCRKEKMEALEHSAWISISTHFWMKRTRKGYITAVTEFLLVEELAVALGDIVEGEANRLLGDSRVSLIENAVIAMREVMAAEMHEVEADHRETAALIEVLNKNKKKKKGNGYGEKLGLQTLRLLPHSLFVGAVTERTIDLQKNEDVEIGEGTKNELLDFVLLLAQ